MNQIPPPLSVSALNNLVKQCLEHQFPILSVEGEVSNLVKPASGHYYFTLKDANAQIRCVFFRNQHTHVASLAHGSLVTVTGSLSIYEPRGDYQFIVQKVEATGIGALYRQFEILKQKLAAIGLFNEQRKKVIPKFPEKIGIVTSATGAALRDILTTLKRRHPVLEVIVYSTEVQGIEAHLQIIKALKKAFQHNLCDVLILARGGGSLEDLWAFNQESLIYTLAESPIPIITGIGHETDFTLADFVADLRAPTPTAAAEAATPEQIELLTTIQSFSQRLLRSMSIIRTHSQSTDRFQSELIYLMEQHLARIKAKYQNLHHRLLLQNPVTQLKNYKQQINYLTKQLIVIMQKRITQYHHQLQNSMIALDTVSPLATLKRGYAIVSHKQNILTNVNNVDTGEQISVTLHEGKLICEVVKISE